VTALAVVEDLEVLKDRIRELDACPPGLAVQGSSTCIRLQNDSIIALSKQPPDRAHRGWESRVERPPRERPGRELGALIRVDDRPVGPAPLDGHAQGVGDQSGGRRHVDRPADDPTASDVENDRTIDLALSRRVHGDIGDPQPVGLLAPQPALHKVEGRGDAWAAIRIVVAGLLGSLG